MISLFKIFCISILLQSGNPTELSKLRSLFESAVLNENGVDKLKKHAVKSSDNNSSFAYLGVANALQAKYAWNPYNKIDFLKTGMEQLSNAINREPENIEYRYLRFIIQDNIPDFLGMKKNWNTDKELLIGWLKKKEKKDHWLSTKIKEAMILSENINNEERRLIKEL